MAENHDTRLARIEERVEGLYATGMRIEKTLERFGNEFVTQKEFWPVRAIVYTGAGVVMLAVLGGVVAMVVQAAN